MNNNSITNIIWSIPEKLLTLARTIRNIMFYQITIGNVTLSIWYLIGGVGLLAIILYSILKS